MSTQHEYEIPFSISRNHNPWRLIELPSELLELLTSSSPPTLRFKSTDEGSGSAEAALCTPEKSYQLRQVQTSNTLYLVTPSKVPGNQSDDVPKCGIRTLAQCTWALETLKAPEQSALSLLKQALLVYTGSEDSIDGSRHAKTKQSIFADIPLSDGECQTAWSSLMAFEMGNSLSAFRPSAGSIVKTWSSLSLLAIERGMDLSGRLKPTDLEDLAQLSDEIPSQLTMAVLRGLIPAEHPVSIANIALADVDPAMTITLDRKQTVRMVGLSLLESLGEMAATELIRQWQNLMPEPWRDDAQLSAISGSYETASEGQITFVSTSEASQSAATGSKPAPTAAKRKWHEKFAAARKR